MPRQTHGHYDATTGLPNNTMQPTGAGYNVWLNEQVLHIYGATEGQKLIDTSVAQGDRRYAWLLAQLEDEVPQVVEEYHNRRKQAAANRRYREKQQYLKHMEERLAASNHEKEQMYLKKEIEKAQKYLDARKQV